MTKEPKLSKQELEIAMAACCVGTMWDEYEGTEDFDHMVRLRLNHLIELVRKSQPSIPSNLNEAAEKEAEAYWKAQGGGSHAQWDKFRAVVKHFTEWQKEQFLKDAVEGKVIAGKDDSQYIQTICVDIKESLPNKVKLKIIKDDERI